MAMSQQEVIKKFMAALDTTKQSGKDALNEAVKAATGGKVATADEVIKKMIADCKKSKNANDFLMTYCGINLNNNDTGAINGSDAGGKTVKNAEDIVPESGAVKHFTGTSFTKRGLKFIVPTTIKDDTIGTAKDKKYIIDALYTWWAEEALKLIETSYGFSFKDSDATVREISIDFFYDKTPGADIAYTERYDRDEYGNYDGKINRMVLKINMAHYKDFRTSDQNGKSPTGNPYLDRTIAHELTHAIMNAKIDYRYKLPNFISEGMAELTHGIDDESKSRITALAQNTNNRLEKALDIKRTGENTSAASDEYAAGYMFLRYLAKNYSTSAVTSGLNVTNSNKNSIVSGTNYNDTIKNIAGGAVIRGGKGNDSIYSSTEKNYTVKSSYGYVTIDGGAGNDTIYSNDPYVSISGGKDNDSIYSKSSTVTIRGGEGVDTITNYSRHTKIYGDSEGDRIENRAGGVTIYGGGGNDFIKNDTTDKKVTINSAYGYV
ncbi:MAG: hypothetical protein IJU91_08865, partial [Selenomonadaceae bacterium]|nr:hypothetical protein [Selenomonadaceae bacterium]